MQISLSGKTAIVTGGTKGIGFAAAKGLLETGAEVVITGRSENSVNPAVDSLKMAYPSEVVQGVVCDLASAEGCRTLTDAVSHCDILINNAGIYQNQDFFDITDDVWQQYWDSHLPGEFEMRCSPPVML